MKWVNEPGEAFPMLAFTKSEAKMLVDILSGKARNDICRKYEKYKDIYESGEATDKQCDLMFKYEDQLDLINEITSEKI